MLLGNHVQPSVAMVRLALWREAGELLLCTFVVTVRGRGGGEGRGWWLEGDGRGMSEGVGAWSRFTNVMCRRGVERFGGGRGGGGGGGMV